MGMRCLYLVVAVALLTAQYGSCQTEPIITHFDPASTLTWTNMATNMHCDVQWRCNMNHEWMPCGFNLQATQTTTSADIGEFRNLVPQLQMLFRNVAEGYPVGLFFRVVASEQSLDPICFTNMLQVYNVSTTALSDVTCGLKQGGSYVPLTNFSALAPLRTTDVVNVWQIWVPVSGGLTNPPIVPMGDVPDGWYVAYDHNGTNHVHQAEVMPIGPPEKHIMMTISNASMTLHYEWLRLKQTVNY